MSEISLENESTPTEDLQAVQALETSTGPEIRFWQFTYIDYTLSTFSLRTPKRHPSSERKPIDIITLRHKLCTIGIWMVCFFECLLHREAQELFRGAHEGI